MQVNRVRAAKVILALNGNMTKMAKICHKTEMTKPLNSIPHHPIDEIIVLSITHNLFNAHLGYSVGLYVWLLSQPLSTDLL